MSLEMENARKLVELENRANAAVAELNAVSIGLMRMDKDLKVNGWDWNKPGNISYISTQDRIGFEIVDANTR